MLIVFKKVGTAIVKGTVLTGAYFLLAKIGFDLAAYSGYASPIWPASGWALALPLLFGKISLVSVFLGSFLYNFEIQSKVSIELTSWRFLVEAMLIAGGSTLQSFIGSYFFQKFIPNLDLTRNVNFIIRFLWIATLTCLIGATVANFGLYLLGILPLEEVIRTWAVWWTGDTLGIFVYFPFFLAWFRPEVFRAKAHTWTESGGVIFILFLIGAVIFYVFRMNSISAYFPLSYLLITILVLASLKFGLRESSLALILISSIALFATVSNPIAFISPSREITLLLVQSFLAAISITSLLATAIVRDRTETERQLIQSHKQLEELVRERTQELDRSNRFLGATEAIYKGLFENVPIAILECDYSLVKEKLESLSRMSKKEFYKFLIRNPNFVSKCYDSVKVVAVNKESIRLFEAGTKEEVMRSARELFRAEREDRFRKVLFSVRFGGRTLQTDSRLKTCKGRIFDATIRWSLSPEFEDTFSSVIIAVAEITDKKEAERQLKNSLKEKEVMLKEIHHRVKNNLQVISSLFSLQSEYENDPKIHDAFMESQNRIQTMALIHDELYQSTDLGNVEFSGYSKRLTEKIQTAYKIGPDIRLENRSSKLFLEINLAIPLGLILNELLTNCFKYAFPKNFSPDKEKPTIRVHIAQESNRVTLEVADNGIGLPSELDPTQTRSFGLTLVQVLVKQLKGKMDFSSSVGNGTEFRIRFEVQK